MTDDNEHLAPQHGDQQNERLEPHFEVFTSFHSDEKPTLSSDKHLLEDLQTYYQTERETNLASLERAWQRISLKLSQQNESLSQNKSKSVSLPHIQQRKKKMQYQLEEHSGKKNNTQLTIGLLVAIILLALVLGSLPIVYKLAHAGEPQPQIKPTVPVQQHSNPPGKIMYTSPNLSGYAYGVSWSADGKRIAVVLDGTIHISDALTGLHSITLSSLQIDTLVTPVWSPSGELLAVPYNDMVAIVDGGTGDIISTYTAPAASTASTSTTSTLTGNPLAFNTPAQEKHALSNHIALGGPHGDSTVSWSPDGKLVLSTFFQGAAIGTIQAWDPATGNVVYSLKATPGDIIQYGSWSSDGKYIVAYESPSSMPTGTHYLDVWNTQTHELIQQKTISDAIISDLHWQPGTDNVTYNVENLSDFSISFIFWNVRTNQITKTIPQLTGAIWSPDGKKLAYNTINDPVTDSNEIIAILDVNSGKTTSIKAPVQGQSAQFTEPVWSPDGKYIATAQNLLIGGKPTPGTYILQVLAV